MKFTGTIVGKDVAFGARWDDVKNKAPKKAVYGDVTGFYDEDVAMKSCPAPALVNEMINVPDREAVYAIFYHDDDMEIFGSVLFANGNIIQLSEKVYENRAAWELDFDAQVADRDMPLVYYPEGALKPKTLDSVKAYTFDEDVLEGLTLPKVTATSQAKTIAAVAAMLAVVACIPVGAWIFVAKPFEKTTTEVQYVTEKLKPDFDQVLESCMGDLADPWPVPPEWELVKEGCVGAPDVAKVSFPKPADQRPYSYRHYTLDIAKWDDYLSGKSFMKMAERFPGQVVEGTNSFLMYIPYDLETGLVDNAYMPNTQPIGILKDNFVGAMKINQKSGAGNIEGFTELELDKTVGRLKGAKATPEHVFREPRNNVTGVVIGPERIETRQVRVN